MSDIAWTRISKPEDVLSAGSESGQGPQDRSAETKKISLGLKQLQPEPWETAPQRYQVASAFGQVTRIAEFGASRNSSPAWKA